MHNPSEIMPPKNTWLFCQTKDGRKVQGYWLNEKNSILSMSCKLKAGIQHRYEYIPIDEIEFWSTTDF